jgi:hypothetical protein
MDDQLERAAYHEAAHCALAHAAHFAIDYVEINPDGSGYVKYVRPLFDYAEIELWLVGALAGGIVERKIFGGAAADTGDLRKISLMVEKMGLHPCRKCWISFADRLSS